MRSPLRIIIPRVWGTVFLCFRGIFLFRVPLWSFFRGISIIFLLKSLSVLFPRWPVFRARGTRRIGGAFLCVVGISLLPFRVVGLHFPVLGVGLRLALWVIVTGVSFSFRSWQYKKEYLGDTTLSVFWVIISIFIERISRGARAITLGARIRVNIIIGGILHSVVGETSRRRGIIGLAVFEGLVVLIQVYVFILLLCLYAAELR